MQTQTRTSPALGDYVEILDLSRDPAISKSYPTTDSIRWFVRKHRALLVARGAMIIVAGRMRFHPDLFQEVAIEVGLVSAAAKGGICHG